VRDRPTLLLYALLAGWGFFNYGFGPVVALLRDEQHISRGLASLHGTSFAAGAVLGGIVTPWLVRRYGRPTTMWLGLAGICAAITALCAVRPLPATLTCAGVIGTAGTMLLSGLISGLSDHHGRAAPAAISEANALACAAGALAPLLIGVSTGAGWTWRPGLGLSVVFFGGLAAIAAIARIRLPAGTPVGRATSGVLSGRSASNTSVSRSNRLPGAYWLAFTVIALCGSVEVSINLWAADLLRDRSGLSPADAAGAVAAIVGGMFLGRLAGGRLALRLPATRLLLAALAVSVAGFAVFWLATVAALAVVGLIVCGIGNGLHFPLGISLALRHSAGQPDLATARGAYAMAIAYGVAPFALGGFADRVGVRWAFLLVPLLLAAAAAVTTRLAAAGEGDAVGERQHDRVDPVVGDHHVVEGDHRPGVGVIGIGVDDPAVA
jgi:fucose permease